MPKTGSYPSLSIWPRNFTAAAIQSTTTRHGSVRGASCGATVTQETIDLVNSEDIQRVIDRAHEQVYGESRVSRIARLKPLEDDSGEPDWDAFDSPTYERK